MGLYEQIRDVAKEKGYSINKLEQELGFARSSINKFNKNRPSLDKIQQIADFLNVSVERLTGIYTDDHDIKKHIDMIMESLEGQETIIYENQEVKLNEHSKRMLRYAMEMAYEAARNNILEQQNEEKNKE